jgi:tetratricopeptide (TPR) repeat protein
MRLILLLLISLNFVFANRQDNLFSEANELYKNQEFRKAIELYNEVKHNGYTSPELFYNLGNAYYKTDQIGKAILNYEKALKINPTDEDIIFNLNIAKLKTVDKIDQVPEVFIVRSWRNLVESMDSNAWSYTSITVFFLFIFFIAVFIFSRTGTIKKLSFAVASFFLLFAIILSIASFEKLQIERDKNYAIILEPSVYIKSAPSDSSTDLFILHEGTKLNIITKDGNWLKFKLSDGSEGWIQSNTIGRI